jgi:hypothetical protein
MQSVTKLVKQRWEMPMDVERYMVDTCGKLPEDLHYGR